MKVKQLDVIGFKSFVDKTTVLFPHGICAVVGPNGCGKSNIVDAMRWVMGEQSVKQLRGKSMEDVIFAGTEKKPPLNMAEVSLTLINDNGSTPEEYRQFSEIMVSRRLFRSGESAYFINKQPCRLKDIQNLLMGTGVGSRTYGVVEQGRVVALIDASPEERRFFIEEAAGITRYKSRKNEAIQKINRTQQNLLRVNDVIVEVKRQMNSLRRQARKAERYKTFQTKIEHLEVMLATYRYKVICDKMREAEALTQSLMDTDFKHESELAKLDAAIEEIKQERAAKHQNISEHKAQRHQLQRVIDKLEQDIDYAAKEIERLSNEADQLKAELKETDEKKQSITAECHQLEEQRQALQQDIEKTKETLKQSKESEQAVKERLAELNQSLEANKAELINLASRRAAYENTLENASRQRSGLSRRLDQIKKEKSQTENEIAKLEKEKTKCEEDNNALVQSIAETVEALEYLDKQLEEKRQALSRQVRKVQTMEAERQKVRSRYGALKKMDDNYEWFREGVRVIMRDWNTKGPDETGIYGLVADIIEPETTYEDAVEAALGETLQYVLVKDQEGGMEAIDFLRAQSAGRSGFIPVKALRPMIDKDHTVLPDGQELLINNIKVKQGYQQVVQSLLGHVLVAENLETALQLWNRNGSRQAIVTRQGDRVCQQGILIGGSPENGSSGILAKKKEMKELTEQISDLDVSMEAAKSEQKQLEGETVELETEVQKARQALSQENQHQIQVEKELYRLQEKFKHTRHHLEILDLESQQIEGEQADVEQELYRHQGVVAELAKEIQTVESTIAGTNAKIEEVSEDLEAASQKVVGLKLELTTLEAQCDHAENTLRRLKDFQNDRLKKLNQLSQQVKQREEDRVATQDRLAKDRDRLERLYAGLKTMEETLAESEAGYQAIEGMLEQNDRALSKVRSAQQETAQKIQQLELKQSERRMTRDQLIGRIHENYHLNIETSCNEFDADNFSEEETQTALARYRKRAARIGEVNLGAIHEYENLSERHRSLTEQRDDLIGAIEALHRVIRKINRTSLKQFVKAFKAVNEKLQIVFPRLFEGGTANLVLMDPKRPLESGVSYLVHPPGKKLTRMSLLSGGEKALAAIAMIFSLFLIKPAAFCVLDEIDAPLDDINVVRFNHLLREIGNESQVIVITHSKQTMEMADALFGVTMEDKGISKLVSLNFTNNRES
ncbi:MAG: chromosome segregation protein SMC [Desulfobacterales bacterium]|nr:chromosome segregation protein SMC [Desulfobacterales bacterium]